MPRGKTDGENLSLTLEGLEGRDVKFSNEPEDRIEIAFLNGNFFSDKVVLDKEKVKKLKDFFNNKPSCA